MNILIVIPARGGSKGIPRKNLRFLNGKPLIYYAISTALASKFSPDVYVSSEDEEILSISKKYGANIHKRDLDLADDYTTLDPVIYNCFEYAQKEENKNYDLVVTMQVTSPLLNTSSLDNALDKIIQTANIDTIISAKDNTHLSWILENDNFKPNYKERLNRQYLTPTYTETGGFLITRASLISEQNRIGDTVDLYILSNGEEIDIDDYVDWHICEYYLKKKKILFVVTGNYEVGLGHVYNTLLVANDILNHQILFLVDSKSHLAYEAIKSKNYPVEIQSSKNIIDDINNIAPNVIINDRLNTSTNYMQELKDEGYYCINFEDLGEGSKIADLVFNAIYPEKERFPNHYYGPSYFILREEFLNIYPRPLSKEVKKVLLTFGGVDPNNFTKKVLDSIYLECKNRGIHITIILGYGYKALQTLDEFKDIEVFKNVSNIAEHMSEADIIFTSAGRTAYEVASTGTPAIVLAQNERELTHFFASSKYGFTNLGLGLNCSSKTILNHFTQYLDDFELRNTMHQRMLEHDLGGGRSRVNFIIRKFLDEL